jgi:hypothetical protein
MKFEGNLIPEIERFFNHREKFHGNLRKHAKEVSGSQPLISRQKQFNLLAFGWLFEIAKIVSSPSSNN